MLQTSFYGVTEKQRYGFALIADLDTVPEVRNSRIETDLQRLKLKQSSKLNTLTGKHSRISRDNTALVKYRRAVTKTSHYASGTHLFAELIKRYNRNAQELQSAENFEQAGTELRKAKQVRKLMQRTQAQYQSAAEWELITASQLLTTQSKLAEQLDRMINALLKVQLEAGATSKHKAAQRTSKQITASVKDIHLAEVMASSAGDIAPPELVTAHTAHPKTSECSTHKGGLIT